MASLMQELIATLRKEQEAYQELLPVVEQKTQAIIANDLQKVQAITEFEQSAIGKISGLEQKRTEIMKNISWQDFENLSKLPIIEICDIVPSLNFCTISSISKPTSSKTFILSITDCFSSLVNVIFCGSRRY